MGFVKPISKNEPPEHVCMMPATTGMLGFNKYPEGTLYDCDTCKVRYRLLYRRSRSGRVGLGNWVRVTKKQFPAEGD